jgi:hypothetical protein
MQQAIDLLGSQGATVVLPTVPCFLRRGEKLADVPDSQSPFNPSRVHRANELRGQLRPPPGGRLLAPDLHAHVCAGGRFHETLPGMRPGQDGRPDGVHFSSDGARAVGRWLKPTLETATGQPPALAPRT